MKLSALQKHSSQDRLHETAEQKGRSRHQACVSMSIEVREITWPLHPIQYPVPKSREGSDVFTRDDASVAVLNFILATFPSSLSPFFLLSSRKSAVSRWAKFGPSGMEVAMQAAGAVVAGAGRSGHIGLSPEAKEHPGRSSNELEPHNPSTSYLGPEMESSTFQVLFTASQVA